MMLSHSTTTANWNFSSSCYLHHIRTYLRVFTSGTLSILSTIHTTMMMARSVSAKPPFLKNEKSPTASYILPDTVSLSTAYGTTYMVGI